MNPYKNHVNTGREKTIFCFLESQLTKTYALSESVLFTAVKTFPPIISAPKKTIFVRCAPFPYHSPNSFLHVGHFLSEKAPKIPKKYGFQKTNTIHAYEFKSIYTQML